MATRDPDAEHGGPSASGVGPAMPVIPAFQAPPGAPPLPTPPPPPMPTATGPLGPGAEPSMALAGVLRWEDVERRQAQLYGRDSADYDAWVLSLKHDPADVEYTAQLARAQEAAGQRQAAREKKDTTPAPGSLDVLKQSKPHDVEGRRKALNEAPGSLDDLKQSKPHDRNRNTIWVDANGEPVKPPGQVGSTTRRVGAVDDYAAKNGISADDTVTPTDPNDEKQAPVFWGTGKTAEGITSRILMTVEEAEKYLYTLDPDEVKQIQKAFGEEETGYIVKGDKISNYWNKVVATAAIHNSMGSQISPKDFFMAQLKALVEKGRRGGGGGGGGGRRGGGGGGGGAGGIGLAEYDYYQAMMQVLSDLSGLPNG